MKKFNKPVVLVAPLDWGLGHATRCIPLINEFLRLNCEVIIAAEGDQHAILKTAFPNLLFIHIPVYNIRYGRTGFTTILKLIMQGPAILSAIRNEHRWLRKSVKDYSIDLVVSDNRYGLYNAHVRCVFITHQLHISTNLGKLADRIIQKINYRYINKFNECWIPDYKNKPGLAGILSHPDNYPSVPKTYIGALTRFPDKITAVTGKHILIILSGPEPQRSILEDKLINAFAEVEEPVVMIRGLPSSAPVIRNTNSYIKIFDHLDTDAFFNVIIEAKYIICRSGYSSVMDLIPLGKTCVFIPTPGQSEQVYLAKHLASAQLCLFYSQEDFSLETMFDGLRKFKRKDLQYSEDDFKIVLRDAVNRFFDND